MKNISRIRPTICAAAILGCATGAFAQNAEDEGGVTESFSRKNAFSADFSAGVDYDSNVSVIDIDTSTAADDFAAVFDFGLGFERELGENTKFEAGYDFSQDIQFELSAFDTQMHRGSAEISHGFGAVDTGASYQYVYSKLGGSGFLKMHRLSPYVASYAANKKLYLRGSYIYTDKTFVGRPSRDATVHAGDATAYIFLNGLNTYLIGGYRYESQDAVAPEFDFDSHNTKVRFVQRVPLGDRHAKFRAGWRYENRNYSAITPSIGVIRDDERHKFDASLEVPINDILYTALEGEYDDFKSNLPSADFNQSIATIRIGGRL